MLKGKSKKTIKKNRELKEEFGGVVPDQLSREDFEKYQLFRVREQMRYSEENVPYYSACYQVRYKTADSKTEDSLGHNQWQYAQRLGQSELYHTRG